MIEKFFKNPQKSLKNFSKIPQNFFQNSFKNPLKIDPKSLKKSCDCLFSYCRRNEPRWKTPILLFLLQQPQEAEDDDDVEEEEEVGEVGEVEEVVLEEDLEQQ